LKGTTLAYSQFKTLGLDAAQIPQNIAVTGEYLEGAGGQEAKALFAKGISSLGMEEIED